MGFEEIREKLLYLHKHRKFSKRTNRFNAPDEEENIPTNKLKSESSRSRRSKEKIEDYITLETKRKKRSDYSSSEDPYEKYEPSNEPKNKARYLPPSKLKKQPVSYQGRRVVKFKEKSEYSEEQYGSLKREKKPAPRKILCVTEIMADISDTESSGESETHSVEKSIPLSSSSSVQNSVSDGPSTTSSLDNNSMQPPDKMTFLLNFRKRSIKGREKETETKTEGVISESLINRIHNSVQPFKIPFAKKTKEDEEGMKIASMVMRKFHDKGSISKLIQKTAKLQRNMDEKLATDPSQDHATEDVIRLCMQQRIKSLHIAKAKEFSGRQRKRGKVETRFIKLRYQEPKRENEGPKKRQTTNFNLYDQKALDFIDANNLLSKKLNEFEFDNDIASDEDEIAKSSYVRLKDLTVCLKQTLNKGLMYDNDADDLAIKRHVGLSEHDKV